MPRPDPTSIATCRFGLGPRPGERAAARPDPQGWLLDQLGRPPRTAFDRSHLDLQREAHGHRVGGSVGEAFEAMFQETRQIRRAEAEARLQAARTTDAPFAERWVRFWANHFTVSVTQPIVLHLVGAFEREVARAHAFGRFEDLLVQSTRHPAMLLYLDNTRSVGPRSRVGRRRGIGLNENLAREVLELHTLGVDGGYGQADVEALAAMLTGWTVFGGKAWVSPDFSGSHGFTFAPRLHEPGDKTLLGTRYPEAGEAEARAALGALARHPATAAHVARKLARHFVADDPPDKVVAHLTATFRDTDGDLSELARALITHPLSWRGPEDAKLRTPELLLVALVRGLDDGRTTALPQRQARRVTDAQAWLGQPDFRAPSPAGWPDTAAAWAGSEQLLRRVELAGQLGPLLGPRIDDPEAWAAEVLGPRLRGRLARAVAGAPTRADAVALTLASPAFQWT